MLQWFMNGEYTYAKEMRQIAEEYIGSVAYHIPIEAVANELRKHGFVIEARGQYL